MLGFAWKKDSEKGNGDENRAKTLNFEKSNSLNSSLNPKPSQQRGAYAAFGQHPDRSRAEEPVREGRSGGACTTHDAPCAPPLASARVLRPPAPVRVAREAREAAGAGSTFQFHSSLESRQDSTLGCPAGAPAARRRHALPKARVAGDAALFQGLVMVLGARALAGGLMRKGRAELRAPQGGSGRRARCAAWRCDGGGPRALGRASMPRR